MDKKIRPNSLGRGLGALLGEDQILAPSSIARIKSETNSYIKISSIEANPSQPRKDFEQESLEELATSIKTYGVIQPITVRPVESGKYQLISGERRLRASQLAGLQEIPAYVRTVDEIQSIQMALVENIQRENLNAMEIAVSYQRLLDECSLTQEEMSEKVGKKRSTVANYLRLLKLSHEAKIAIRDNKISMGHAKALVSVDNEEMQAKIVNQIVNQELSVRQTESLVKKFSNTVKKTKVTLTLSDEIVNFQTSLSEKLQTKVLIKKELSGKGKITIPFTSDIALKEMLEKLQ